MSGFILSYVESILDLLDNIYIISKQKTELEILRKFKIPITDEMKKNIIKQNALPTVFLSTLISHLAMISISEFGDICPHKNFFNSVATLINAQISPVQLPHDFYKRFLSKLSTMRREFGSKIEAKLSLDRENDNYLSFFFCEAELTKRKKKIKKIPGINRLGCFVELYPEFKTLENVNFKVLCSIFLLINIF